MSIKNPFQNPSLENKPEVEAWPEKAANFQGNWAEVLRERLSDPEIKKKFFATKQEHPTSSEEKTDAVGIGPKLKKKVLDQEDVEATMANYEAIIDKVFISTDYDDAATFGHLPSALGANRGYGDTGAVFRDAAKDGKTLSDRGKSIIEAHEKAHGILMNLTEGEKEEIRTGFQFRLEKYKDKAQADELLARMSQLKNYFGFKGNEQFTKEHLAYAREHYIQDTGLDNDMTSFFEAVPNEKEDEFVHIMNKYAF